MDIKELSGLLYEYLEQNVENSTSLGDIELQVKQITRRVGREMLRQYLKSCEKQDIDPSTRCSRCGGEAKFISTQVGYARTALGAVRYRRACYECSHCTQQTYPLDERLDPLKSLARLRAKITAGQNLPVAELAKSWGLGSVRRVPNRPHDTVSLSTENPHLQSASSDGLNPLHLFPEPRVTCEVQNHA
jgi:hypothetical protein